MKVLLIDHDDSFTYNLQDWLKPICSEIIVVNHREARSSDFKPELIVLSPGPHSAQDYPHIIEFIKSQSIPIFGVCLGLQMLVYAGGGKSEAYTPPLHGKKSPLTILVDDFRSLQNAEVARYHSLKCLANDSLGFITIAVAADDQVPMWLQHRQKKWMGVQFHPESFLTERPELHLKFLQNWFSV